MADRYGTMKNEQTEREGTGLRAVFARNNDGKGASRDLSSLFSSDNPISAANREVAFEDTKSELTGLYKLNGGVPAGQNPDFPEGFSDSRFRYEDSIGMLSSTVNAEDKPSTKGPNTRTISIGNDGLPIIPEGHENSQPETNMNGGFGNNFDRNEEENVLGAKKSYITRRDNNEVTLGEYIDIANYLSDLPEE
jgi:hypothetical protein